MALQVEELEALIKDLRWEHFEATPMGQIEVEGRLFCMRIGLHMDRPVQAIICDGQFVRLRSADYYRDKKLYKLDPDRLAESLYMEAAAHSGYPIWRPFLPAPITSGGVTSQMLGVGGGGGTSTLLTQQQLMQQASQQKQKMEMDWEQMRIVLESEIAKGKPFKWFPWSPTKYSK